jgi:hypothetical protein
VFDKYNSIFFKQITPEQWRRNQKTALELIQWLHNYRAKYIVSVYGLFTQIKYGWDQKREYIFYAYRPFFSALLEGLKARGYIQTYCVVPTLLLNYKGVVKEVVVI